MTAPKAAAARSAPVGACGPATTWSAASRPSRPSGTSGAMADSFRSRFTLLCVDACGGAARGATNGGLLSPIARSADPAAPSARSSTAARCTAHWRSCIRASRANGASSATESWNRLTWGRVAQGACGGRVGETERTRGGPPSRPGREARVARTALATASPSVRISPPPAPRLRPNGTGGATAR